MTVLWICNTGMFCFSLTVGNCYTHKRSIIQCVLLLVTTSFLIQRNLEICYCNKAKENCRVTVDRIIIVNTVKLHSPAMGSMAYTTHIQTLGTPTWHADPFMTDEFWTIFGNCNGYLKSWDEAHLN